MDEAIDASAVLAALTEYWTDPPQDILDFDEATAGRLAGSEQDQLVPEGTENPYWEIIRQMPLTGTDWASTDWVTGRPSPKTLVARKAAGTVELIAGRVQLCSTFSWSIPSPGDVEWLKAVLGGRGVVECGAGGGYWTWQMRQAGIDAVAYEPHPAPDGNFLALREWAALLPGDHAAAGRHPDRALFLSWPSYDDPWAASALACYQGDTLIYAADNSLCADGKFFEMLRAGWEAFDLSAAHVSYWGIRCHLVAFRRK